MTAQIDRMTRYLISNGDVPAVTNQTIYEYAWGQGIRPVREDRLKPERFTRGRRREPRHERAGKQSAGRLFGEYVETGPVIWEAH